MKYLQLLVVCLLSFSASAFEDILYDFNTRTPASDIFAFKGESSTQVPTNEDFPSTQVSAAEYTDLTVDDQTYQQSSTTTMNNYPSTRFLLFVDQAVADITQFEILWNGYGVSTQNINVGVDFYIWNFRLNSYEFIIGTPTSDEYILTGTVTSNITDYFGGDSQNSIVFYVVSQNNNNGNNNNTSVYSDYVSLTVTVPDPVFAMANFQFDECVYTGTGNEVIDQLGNYSGTSHNSVSTSEEAQIENALAISSASHHVQTSIPLPDRYSVSTWFKKPTDITGSPYFVLGSMENGNDLLLIDRENDWRWAIYRSNVQLGIYGTYSFKNLSDSWHHMALVYTYGQTNLYIDGVFIEAIELIPTGTLKYVGTSFDDVNTTEPQGFRAPLDEFIVFNGALTDNTVATIYNNQRVGTNYDGGVRASPNCIVLIAQYSLDESSWSSVAGEVLDSTGGLNGQAFKGANTALSSPALTGNPGTCGFGVFDGIDDYVSIADSAALDIQRELTITVWINPKSLPNIGIDPNPTDLHTIVSKDENYELHLNHAGEINWWWQTNELSTTGAGIVPDSWYHIAITYQSGQQVIYINGVERASSAFTEQLTVNDVALRIGQDQNQPVGEDIRYFDGFIDEVKIYKGALNATEVNEVYNERHACAEPVIHHYEIVHDGNGLTCAAEPITIKACTNSACTSESTASVSLNFNITSPTTGTVTKASPTFTGSTIIELSHTTAETITLSINNASIAASNAVECSGVGTSCDMTFADAGFRFLYGDTNSETIGHQTSGVEFVEAVKLQAVKSNNGVCEGLFTGDVNISLSQQNVTPDLDFNAGLAFQSDVTNIAKHPQFTDNVSVNFGNDSIAIIPTPKYLDAGEIRLNAKYTNADFTIVGSSNDFWVKPENFEITATNLNGVLNGNSAISTTIHNAGNNFEFTVSALNVAGDLTQNYRQADGQLQLKVSRIAPVLNSTVDGGFIYAAGQNRTTSTDASFQNAQLTSFTEGDKGTAVFSGAQYDEVGVINIDIQDINYGGLGNVNGLIVAVDQDVGRFTPAYFKQSVKAEHKGQLDAYHSATGSCAIADWAYNGQRTNDDKGAITYSIEPKITITSYNANNAVTKNFTLGEPEGFMKLLATGVDIKLPTHDETQQIVGSLADNPVALTAVMQAGSLSASLDVDDNFIAGEWLYTFSSDDHFSYNKNDTSFLAPFNAQIPFVTNQVEDSDGVLLSSNIDAAEKLLTDGVEIRFARMVLENSYGSENTMLRAPLNVEVYDGSNFIINTDESCLSTLIGDKKSGAKYSGNMNLWDYRLIDIDTDEIQVSDTSASVSGVFNLGIQAQLSFSTPGKQGTLEWEYEVPSWLKFKWDNVDTDNDGNFYDDNPSAILSFGIYRGNDRIISWREIVN
jgi:MSHA biogenesis protein MshQ